MQPRGHPNTPCWRGTTGRAAATCRIDLYRHLLHFTDGRDSAVFDGEEMYHSASDDDYGSHLDMTWGSHDPDAGTAAAHSASRCTSAPCAHDSRSRCAFSTESSTV